MIAGRVFPHGDKHRTSGDIGSTFSAFHVPTECGGTLLNNIDYETQLNVSSRMKGSRECSFRDKGFLDLKLFRRQCIEIMMSTKTRNILWMFVLMALAIAGAVPVLLLLASLFIGTGPSTGGISVGRGVVVLLLKIILGLIVIGVLAFGIYLHRRGAPFE